MESIITWTRAIYGDLCGASTAQVALDDVHMDTYCQLALIVSMFLLCLNAVLHVLTKQANQITEEMKIASHEMQLELRRRQAEHQAAMDADRTKLEEINAEASAVCEEETRLAAVHHRHTQRLLEAEGVQSQLQAEGQRVKQEVQDLTDRQMKVLAARKATIAERTATLRQLNEECDELRVLLERAYNINRAVIKEMLHQAPATSGGEQQRMSLEQRQQPHEQDATVDDEDVSVMTSDEDDKETSAPTTASDASEDGTSSPADGRRNWIAGMSPFSPTTAAYHLALTRLVQNTEERQEALASIEADTDAVEQENKRLAQVIRRALARIDELKRIADQQQDVIDEMEFVLAEAERATYEEYGFTSVAAHVDALTVIVDEKREQLELLLDRIDMARGALPPRAAAASTTPAVARAAEEVPEEKAAVEAAHVLHPPRALPSPSTPKAPAAVEPMVVDDVIETIKQPAVVAAVPVVVAPATLSAVAASSPARPSAIVALESTPRREAVDEEAAATVAAVTSTSTEKKKTMTPVVVPSSPSADGTCTTAPSSLADVAKSPVVVVIVEAAKVAEDAPADTPPPAAAAVASSSLAADASKDAALVVVVGVEEAAAASPAAAAASVSPQSSRGSPSLPSPTEQGSPFPTQQRDVAAVDHDELKLLAGAGAFLEDPPLSGDDDDDDDSLLRTTTATSRTSLLRGPIGRQLPGRHQPLPPQEVSRLEKDDEAEEDHLMLPSDGSSPCGRPSVVVHFNAATASSLRVGGGGGVGESRGARLRGNGGSTIAQPPRRLAAAMTATPQAKDPNQSSGAATATKPPVATTSDATTVQAGRLIITEAMRRLEQFSEADDFVSSLKIDD